MLELYQLPEASCVNSCGAKRRGGHIPHTYRLSAICKGDRQLTLVGRLDGEKEVCRSLTVSSCYDGIFSFLITPLSGAAPRQLPLSHIPSRRRDAPTGGGGGKDGREQLRQQGVPAPGSKTARDEEASRRDMGSEEKGRKGRGTRRRRKRGSHHRLPLRSLRG